MEDTFSLIKTVRSAFFSLLRRDLEDILKCNTYFKIYFMYIHPSSLAQRCSDHILHALDFECSHIGFYACVWIAA